MFVYCVYIVGEGLEDLKSFSSPRHEICLVLESHEHLSSLLEDAQSQRNCYTTERDGWEKGKQWPPFKGQEMLGD